MSETILITGANGFIGHHLTREACNQQLEVFAGVRKDSNLNLMEGINCKIVHLDYSDVESLTQIISEIQPDYIIHNAGITRTPDYKEFLKVNKKYLINLVEAIRNSKISLKKLLFVSSLAAFGPADFQSDNIIRNTSKPHPVTNYGRSKLEAEKWLWQQKDIPFNIVRPTAVYGPGEKDFLNVFKMTAKGFNAQIGFGSQELTFIYVRDLVQLMLLATKTPLTHQSYFGSDGQVYSATDFAEKIANYFGKNLFTLRLPAFVVKVFARLTEILGWFIGKYPTLYADRVDEIKAKSWKCDNAPAQNDLNFKPKVLLDEGIKITADWYKANGWV